MSLEQTIKDTVIAESQDLDGRLQQLVRAGLMPSNTIPVLRKAIAKVQGGMTLQGAERDVMANFINSMMFIVLGDDSIFNKARAGAKTYATEAKEKTEYDYEGDMAMGQLKSIIANSQRMHDMLSDDTNLPEWVQSKITLAEDYISTASNYMQGEMSEEVQIDEVLPLVAGAAARYAAGKAGAGVVGRTVAGAATKYAVSKSMNKEEVEVIDELSGATLGSYIAKSRKDEKSRKEHGIKVRDELRKATGMNFGTPIDRKLYSPTASRGAGQKTAMKKLTGQARVNANEEVQIDELSKKTMGSYVKKASGAEQPKNVMSPKNVPLTKIAAYQGDSETGHFGKRFNQATYDKAERLRKNRETGIKRAVDKITKEEVEQVDEISKKTMGRYINKAKDSIDMTSYRSGIKDGTAISSSTPYKSNNPLERKLTKRHKGISMAVKKLTKEDIDAAKSMNESYKTKFDAALEHYNIKSPSELGEEQRKEFFNHVDQEFKKGDN
jgi:hypothetical protein